MRFYQFLKDIFKQLYAITDKRLVKALNREQAVNVIKQIFDQCSYMEGRSLKLMAPKENNALSHTYQIHIQTRDNKTLKSCIETVAKKNGLEVKQTDDLVIIYKPYPDLQV